MTKRLYKDHSAKVGNLGQGLKVRVIKILSEHCPDLWKGLRRKANNVFVQGKGSGVKPVTSSHAVRGKRKNL